MNIDSTVYTNYYQTNFQGTNVLIFTTTVDDPILDTFDPTTLTYVDLTNDANVVSFTNLLLTNIYVTNLFQDNLYGNLSLILTCMRM